MEAPLTDSGNSAPMLLPVNGHHVAVWRFGLRGGWPAVWHHGGLSCGLHARVMEVARPPVPHRLQMRFHPTMKKPLGRQPNRRDERHRGRRSHTTNFRI